MDIIVGIDLGTTNSEVARVREGQPHVFTEDGDPILPSFVGLAEDGRLLVGGGQQDVDRLPRIGRRAARTHPQRRVSRKRGTSRQREKEALNPFAQHEVACAGDKPAGDEDHHWE